MKNTIENKGSFFGNYWGQKIFVFPENNMIPQKVGVSYMDNYGINNRALLLKQISSITEEHALKVAEIFDLDESQIKATDLPEWIEALFQDEAGFYIDGYRGDQLLEAIDFLRSEGYALKWRNLSVERQIEYGWVKLSQ